VRPSTTDAAVALAGTSINYRWKNKKPYEKGKPTEQ